MERDIASHRQRYPDAEEMRVIFLGDYVDRGPASRDVLARLSRGDGFAGLSARFLIGNHEDALLRFLNDPQLAAGWLQYGGLATLASYGVPARPDPKSSELAAMRDRLEATLPPEHLAFLQSLELWIEVGGYLFVHAGVRPGVALARQSRRDLLEIRDPFLRSTASQPWRIVHGHTVMPEAEFTDTRISIDTGAYATGRLSCAVIQGADAALLRP